MKLKNPNPGRPVPPNYKFKIELDVYREFTWMERIQILFGYRAVIAVRILTCHSPGQHDPHVNLMVTGELLES